MNIVANLFQPLLFYYISIIFQKNMRVEYKSDVKIKTTKYVYANAPILLTSKKNTTEITFSVIFFIQTLITRIWNPRNCCGWGEES